LSLGCFHILTTRDLPLFFGPGVWEFGLLGS
jgi:hypothetical protein